MATWGQPTTLFTIAPADTPRRYIPINEQNPQHIPEDLINSVIAVADPNFLSNPGYSIQEINNPNAHPTIAQKLVSELITYNEEPSLRRAIRERILAAQITAQFGRTQIMEWYLNSANFGNYAFGVEAASQLYFGKSSEQLTLAESAILAATSETPALNPLDAPQLALQQARSDLCFERAWDRKRFWSCMDTLKEKNYLEELWQSSKAPWKVW